MRFRPARFESGRIDTLVATDVAARGIDVAGITHVINFDAPAQTEDYVHRIGRTARAGAEGDAISFADEEYVFSLDAIEKLIGRRIPAEVADPALYRHPEVRTRITRPRHDGPRAAHRGPRAAAPRAPHPHPHAPHPASPAAASTSDSEGSMTYGRSKRRVRR